MHMHMHMHNIHAQHAHAHVHVFSGAGWIGASEVIERDMARAPAPAGESGGVVWVVELAMTIGGVGSGAPSLAGEGGGVVWVVELAMTVGEVGAGAGGWEGRPRFPPDSMRGLVRAFQGKLPCGDHSRSDSTSTLGHRYSGSLQWDVEPLWHPRWFLQALHRSHACHWKFTEVLSLGSLLLATGSAFRVWFWCSKNRRCCGVSSSSVPCCGVCSSGVSS